MTTDNEQARAVNAGPREPEEVAPPSLAGGLWEVESLRVGHNWSVTSNGIQVATFARRDLAVIVCDAMNARNALLREVKKPFEDRLGILDHAAWGQAEVLHRALKMVDGR